AAGSPALAATACERGGSGQSAAAEPAPAAPSAAADDFMVPEGATGITTAPARSAELPDYLDITGRIQADPTRVVRVYAPVSGRARLELLRADPDSASDRLSVRAPRSGVVIDVTAAPGEFAKSLDNSNPLCVIADLSEVWAVGDVYEKDVASIHVGAPAAVTA